MVWCFFLLGHLKCLFLTNDVGVSFPLRIFSTTETMLYFNYYKKMQI